MFLKKNFLTISKSLGRKFSMLNLSKTYNKETLSINENLKMLDVINKRPFTVCIEGNIACGKTTLLNYFAKFPEVEVFPEPVKKWTNLKEHNLMDLMYNDPVRWSHLFQTYVQLTMIEQHMKPSSKPTKMIDRSLYSARYCFVENLYRTKRMSEPEYLVYCEWFNMISNTLDCSVDLIVYLRTDPKVLNDRILGRDRKEEKKIPLDYLESLHDLHEEWLIRSSFHESTPVVVIDANGSLSQVREAYAKHTKLIVRGQLIPASVRNRSPSPNRNAKKRLRAQLNNEVASAN